MSLKDLKCKRYAIPVRWGRDAGGKEWQREQRNTEGPFKGVTGLQLCPWWGGAEGVGSWQGRVGGGRFPRGSVQGSAGKQGCSD